MDRKYNIAFTKAVASGNDFIIIDNKSGELDMRDFDYSKIAQDLCRRRLSVGADGILVLESSDKADFRMRIVNPDGSEVDMCGNGARCSVLYASLCGWGDDLTFETGAGLLASKVSGDSVRLKMSDPVDTKLNVNLGIGESMLITHFINSGVPHVVHFVEDLDNYDVKNTGSAIRCHSLFAPAGTNANFVKKPDDKGIAKIRTYERGVEGETLACGTGTVASAIMLGLLDFAESPVKLQTKSGEILTVHFDISGDKVTDVYLEGSACIVCEGRV